MTQDTAITSDQIDDLLYYARAGETSDLLATITEISQSTSRPAPAILCAAVDEHSGNSALHMCAANGHVATTKAVISLLPPRSAPDAPPHELVSHKNTAGNTALHWASLNGHLEVVKFLVMEANADPTVTNAAGHDVVYEAELNDKAQVVEWLLGACDGLEEGVDKGNGTGEEKDGEMLKSEIEKDEEMKDA